MTRRAVVLLSGGLDSATVLAIARARGFTCHALSFRYGQRHEVELEAAVRVAHALGATEHRIVDVDLRWIGASALTADLPVPKDRDPRATAQDIPITYVPARNALFLCYALAWAEALGAADLFAGMNALDYSGYPDCRPEFVAAFEHMARLGTRAGVTGVPLTIHTPLIHMSKADIVREGLRLNIDYAITHSCYDPDPAGRACGRCDSCVLRKKGFAEANAPDPTPYQET
jgi:7-cyano-7-deazaguanine synthase